MRIDRSYGCVVVSSLDVTATKVLLVYQASGDHWGFPKGHREEGESFAVAACRELEEETGLQIAVDSLDSSLFFEEEYFSVNPLLPSEKVQRVVRYYLVCVPERESSPLVGAEEILSLGWFTFPEAKNLITYQESRTILEEVAQYLNSVGV